MEDQSPKPIRCKAAICRAAGEPLTIEEIVVDPPRAYEIRIKIICTSLCHTDIAFWGAKIKASTITKVVESVGEHVEGFVPGDTVVPTFLGQCDRCSSCASEQNNMCAAVPFVVGPGMRRDGTTRFRDGEGNPVHDLVAVSSFSEYTVVDVNQVVKLDQSVPPKLACLLSCGASTGVGAAWKSAKVEPGSSVVIFGLGSVGLAVIGKLTSGGADYSFECIGLSSVMTDAFRCTKPGKGKTIILGTERNSEPVCLPSTELLFGKCVMGSLFGGIKPKTDIPILAQKCMNKELELEGLITHEIGLQDINKAFDLLLQGKSLRAGGEPLVIEEIVVDPPKAYELRIRIICTSLCHSDVTFWRMKDFPGIFPRIFGHEAFGVVESVGEHVDEFAAGDSVVPTFLGQCSECVDCRSERSNICSKYRFMVRSGMLRDGTSRFSDGSGNPIHHLLGVSSFSEYTVVDVNHAVKMNPAVPPVSEIAGVGAAWKLAKVEPGSSVAIFGKKFGVTHFINPKDLGEKPVSQEIIEITDGGADYCFECIGLAALMADAFKSSREGWGKTIILGVEMHGAPVSIPSLEILHGKSVMGSLFGGVKPKEDIPILADKYLNKELELDKFITHEVDLKDINKAFDLLVQGKSLRQKPVPRFIPCFLHMPQSLARFQPPHLRRGLRDLAPAIVHHFTTQGKKKNMQQQGRAEMEQQVSQLRSELRKVREERDRAHRVLEVTEWKALASANDRTTIETLEAELEASRESEKRMLESLALQTKQLELTKISLEEAQLEIAALQESARRLEAARGTTTTPRGGRHDRDLQRVHGELRVALAAEEKSRKAMEELVMALKEVNAELHATRQQLARAQHEAETARMEADRMHVSVRRREDKLRALSDEVARLRAEAEESFAAWRGKEAGFTACIKASEAELADARRENARLLESQRSGRAEVAKLRDILKQAVKDTKVVKEALEEARSENATLKGMVGDKDKAVKCTRQELENLRVSEAAARDSVKELQSILVATSPSPHARVPVLDKYPSDSKIRPPAGLTRPRRMSETFEGSVYDIFGSADDHKGEVLGAFSSMPRFPGKRNVVMRKVGSLFRWKSFNNK
ncbi:hypothetical protein PR202_ga26785 [Eleusine coracana subsp. coracana]|uniref:Uncharacterized protein n=1 Tax=Eleusine coracana subsp. coracana TaxID=191504 RepID=A0AAV5DF34_ELECO|nr:hypothetical protein PR202_ga26785 [Eleusine coracana subsp. coracana]